MFPALSTKCLLSNTRKLFTEHLDSRARSSAASLSYGMGAICRTLNYVLRLHTFAGWGIRSLKLLGCRRWKSKRRQSEGAEHTVVAATDPGRLQGDPFSKASYVPVCARLAHIIVALSCVKIILLATVEVLRHASGLLLENLPRATMPPRSTHQPH